MTSGRPSLVETCTRNVPGVTYGPTWATLTLPFETRARAAASAEGTGDEAAAAAHALAAAERNSTTERWNVVNVFISSRGSFSGDIVDGWNIRRRPALRHEDRVNGSPRERAARPPE